MIRDARDFGVPGSAALFVDPVSLRYLTGARFTAGAVVIGAGVRALFVDGRYFFKARRILKKPWKVHKSKGDMQSVFAAIKPMGIRSVCVDPESMTAAEYRKITASADGVHVTDADKLADVIRAVKSQKELATIRRAVRLTDDLWGRVRRIVRIGMTERDLLAEIKIEAMRLGAEEMSFEPIVAAGSATAEPHAEASDRAIQGDEPLMVDMGIKIDGYCSDFTRTPYLLRRRAAPPKWFVQFRNEVLAIQNLAYGMIKRGVREPAAISKKIALRLKKNRLTNYYLHSLGHGVGLNIHEEPYMSPKGRTLRSGMVFTIEPGLYRAGSGGVRIEDMACLNRGRLEILTQSPKELFWRM